MTLQEVLAEGGVAVIDRSITVPHNVPTDPFADPPHDAAIIDRLPRDHDRDLYLMKHMVCAVHSSLQAVFNVDALLGQYAGRDMSRSDMRRTVATTLLSLKATLLPLLGMLEHQYHFSTLPPLTPATEPNERRRQAYASLHAAAGECLDIDDAIRECDAASAFDDLCDEGGMFGGRGWTDSEALKRLTSIWNRVRSLGVGEAEGYEVGWWELFVTDRAGE
ncbi:hypothetical protein LTR85_009948 [Meristemomyces frigidus]|nr:hypothetical protein LTR85_009948 [Meristemomyces frigidus]